MLFTNIDTATTIKDTSFIEHYTGINLSMAVSKIKPAIRQAINLNILKWIKESFYDDLKTKFDADTLSSEESKIIKTFQDAIAYYAIVHKLDEGGANLSELGLHYRNDDGITQNVPQWQFFAAKYDLTRKADAFLERFLNYIYTNKSDFTAFAVEHDTYFINTPRKLSDFLALENSIMTFINMLPSMKHIAEVDIYRILGKTLYDELLAGVRASSLTGTKLDFIPYIQRYLAPAALLHALPLLNVDLSDGKLMTVTTADGYRTRKAATDAQIDLLKDALTDNKKQAEHDMKLFINDNATDLGITHEFQTRENLVVSNKSIGIF